MNNDRRSGTEASDSGLENSNTNKRPPGLSTRYMDAKALDLSVTLRSPKAMVMQSKVSSGKGSASALACTNFTLPNAVIGQLIATHF